MSKIGNELNHVAEWLEVDGLGGFASGTVGGARTRRYHALLLVATAPPAKRFVLVNGFEAWVERGGRRFPITAQHYLPDVSYPDGDCRLVRFVREPWPTWTFGLADGTEIEQEIFTTHGASRVVLRWSLRTPSAGARFLLRPLISARDLHALHHENPAFRFSAEVAGESVTWQPYDGVPGILSRSNGIYREDPTWYRGFLYREERDRGLDHSEDLASPGEFEWDLSSGEALWILEAADAREAAVPKRSKVASEARRLRSREMRRRREFPSTLDRGADAYLVRRREGKTIVAGYPWFGDWGRDTFIALRGLCLATGRWKDARDVLCSWAGLVSDGMLPNRFPDRGGVPEYNSVDASLWFVIAAHECISGARAQ